MEAKPVREGAGRKEELLCCPEETWQLLEVTITVTQRQHRTRGMAEDLPMLQNGLLGVSSCQDLGTALG